MGRLLYLPIPSGTAVRSSATTSTLVLQQSLQLRLRVRQNTAGG